MCELLGKLRHVINESSVCNECTLSNGATGPSPEHHAGTQCGNDNTVARNSDLVFRMDTTDIVLTSGRSIARLVS